MRRKIDDFFAIPHSWRSVISSHGTVRSFSSRWPPRAPNRRLPGSVVTNHDVARPITAGWPAVLRGDDDTCVIAQAWAPYGPTGVDAASLDYRTSLGRSCLGTHHAASRHAMSRRSACREASLSHRKATWQNHG